MCDTMVVVHPGGTLFAKNSDRDPNEAQLLEWQPRARHPEGSTLRCTWIEIPQVPETSAVLLSRPFWMWGAEIGANEHGVAIGNEAVFTTEPYSPSGLTGMDLVRLALERSPSAKSAVETIGELLETHGQGGGCGYEKPGFTYHNSFLVADPGSAYVVETAGRHWTAEPVEGARSISNGLTIPDFARRHGGVIKTWASSSRARRARTQELAGSARTAGDLMRILRDHGHGRSWPAYSLLNGGMGAPCVHGGGLAAASQTTASWVADLREEGCLHWVTGTAAPCVSLFKPVRVHEPFDLGPAPGDRAESRSLWWRHEVLHRRLLRDPARHAGEIVSERDAAEAAWLEHPPPSLAAFREGDALLSRWLGRLGATPARDVRPFWVRRYWGARNRRAGLEGES